MPAEETASHIVAMGGGGFAMEPENPLLDDYILSLACGSTPKVCFVPTASADSENFCLRFYEAFSRRDCEPCHLPLFKRQVEDLRSFVLGQDVIYVGGGNTANLLAVWRVHGFDRILREALGKGIVLCGLSAGSLCWFEAGVTDSFGPTLAPFNDGLGFLAGSNCPHYDGEPERRPTYHRLIKEGLLPGYAADDGCALYFEAGRLNRVVTSRKPAGAYRVQMDGGKVAETPLDAEYLG
ncbi:MAG: peptidase [Phycisphaerales bacterium]|nr:peptidase [Phycisphaerales bacterium]